MSKHTSTFLASEPVEVLVNEHVIVEAVLSREHSVTYQTDEWLDTYNNTDSQYTTTTITTTTTTTTTTTVLSHKCSVTYQTDKRLDTYNIARVLQLIQ